MMPDIAAEDFDNAGRCLAFGQPTAAGFHAARAVEAVLEKYWRSFKKIPDDKPTKNTMNDFIKDLQKIKGPNAPEPNQRTVKSLDQFRDLDRNPLMHPRATLTKEDAQTHFNLATGIITTMLAELRDRVDELDQFDMPMIEMLDKRGEDD